MRMQVCALCSLLSAVTIWCCGGQVFGTTFFSEDFESGAPDWTLDSPWGLTTNQVHGGANSLADSPVGPYENNVDKKATVTINLSGSNRPLLSFWHRYNLEEGKDYGYVEVSKDGGSSWQCLFFVTGNSGAKWFQAGIDLGPYANREIRLRFRIITDGAGVFDGWYIDDVEVSENEAITGLPFSDDAETSDSDSKWITSSWERIATDGHNSPHCWLRRAMGRSDMSTELVLRGRIDFGAATNPQLSFWHHKPGYWGFIHISIDGGQSWTEIHRNLDNWADWRRTQLDLFPYTGESNVVIKFAMPNSSGWYIDDIVIGDAPENVYLEPLSDIGEHSLTLTWSENADPDFASYRIYRSFYSDMREAIEIKSITDQATTTYTDSDLIYAARFYYYRIYVVDTEGLWNLQGSNIQGAKTLLGAVVHSCPFTDDMESGDTWGNDTPWGLTDKASHSASHSWTDSPGKFYENNMDRSLTTAVDLGACNRPLLSFWQRYNLEDGKDYGYVEVSKDDGASWQCLFFITGNSIGRWSKEEIDLGSYAYRQVLVRFRIVTDASGTFDGWYIDDVEVSDNLASAPFPFSDNAETSASDDKWIASSWERIATDGHNSPRCWFRPPMGRSDMSTELALRGTVDFSDATNPQLSFWHHKPGYWGFVYISTDGGQNWTEIHRNLDNWADWRRTQLDLSVYMGQPFVAVKFAMPSSNGWYIDDVAISDAPENVYLEPLSDIGEHSLTLTWSENADSDFASYRIYRSFYSDMRDQTEIKSITDRATTTYTDSDLIYAARWYYYRIYVVDTEGLWNMQGSNIQGARTLPGTEVHTLPFTDDMESGDTWGNDAPWGLTNTASHSGSYSWTDSPGKAYENNMDRSLTTAIELAGSNRPLLSFWSRYNLEEGKDYGYVEVSKDAGANWTCLFFVTGNSAGRWLKKEVDLSPYANTEAYLRFRIVTDASGVFDGWYIDDVEVSENAATTPFPFSDDAETDSSDAKWIASSWERIATDGHDSSHCWFRPPMGRSDMSTELVLRGPIDLTNVTNPQLSFWHHKPGYWGYVYLSIDGGQTWRQIYQDPNSWADWRKTQVDLSPYMGEYNVVIKFAMAYSNGWYIDDIEITGEFVGPPKLQISVQDGSGTLSWTPFGTGSYTVQWSQDLKLWNSEGGMPITDTLWPVGQVENLGRWRFWRVSSPQP